MFPEERRNKILEIINEQGRCRVANLAKQLEVSEVTIRMDLDVLEKQGLLSRTHGGAILILRPVMNGLINMRSLRSLKRKKELVGELLNLFPMVIPSSLMWGRP